MKSTSGCKLLVHLWLDHPGQVIRLDLTSLHLTWPAHVHFINLNANWWLDSLSLILRNLILLQPTSSPKEEGKKKKKGGGKTVSSVYLVSLGELMVRWCWPIFYQNVACSFSFLCLFFLYSYYILFLLRQLCTTASPTLCVALCQTPTRSLERWENIIIIIMI